MKVFRKHAVLIHTLHDNFEVSPQFKLDHEPRIFKATQQAEELRDKIIRIQHYALWEIVKPAFEFLHDALSGRKVNVGQVEVLEVLDGVAGLLHPEDAL